MLPSGLKANIYINSWDMNPIFDEIKRISGLDQNHMFNTFNMGIGMVLAVENTDANEILSYMNMLGKEAFIIGEVSEGEGGIHIC